MKEDITAIELHHIVKELEHLVGAKIDKIYQPERYEILLQLHKTGVGKQIVRILIGKLLYLTSVKGEQPKKIPGYCAYLRKYLGSARLEEVEQLQSERIVAFRFNTKAGRRTLYVEFFTKGNAIFCDENDIILSPLESKTWTDRTIKPKETYVYPARKENLFSMEKDDFTQMLQESKADSIVKFLAAELGMGGVYAEEACLLSGIDKKSPLAKLSVAKIGSLFDVVDGIMKKKTDAHIVRAKDDVIKNIVPFKLKVYDEVGLSSEPCESYNVALDSILTVAAESTQENAEKKVQEGKEKKSQNIIDAQEKQIRKMEKQIEEEREKGELIYSNFQLIEDLLRQIKEARKTMSWKEIKEKLKWHNLVKDIEEKTGKITIEI